MTPAQTIFPKKPKDVISPLTPQAEADRIRAKLQRIKEAVTDLDDGLNELEALANEVSKTRTRSKK